MNDDFRRALEDYVTPVLKLFCAAQPGRTPCFSLCADTENSLAKQNRLGRE
jgi:hypothetical protein